MLLQLMQQKKLHYGVTCEFSIDYDLMGKENVLNIDERLMKKHNIKLHLGF